MHVVSPAPQEAWLRALSQTPTRLLTQTPRWMACLQSVGGWRDASRLYELPDGRYLVLPLVERGIGRFSVAASWPYGWGYGGILASDGRVGGSDAALVADDLARHRSLRLSVSPSWREQYWAQPPAGARAESRYLVQVLDLTGGVDRVRSGYSTNVRRSIRRAEGAGLRVERDATGALLPAFAHLYRASVDRWARTAGRPAAVSRLHAALAEPPRHLEAVAATLGAACVVWAAFLDERPVAAVVVLRGDDHTLYWRGAMDRDLAAQTHANALLHHRAISEAVADGHALYSFGESDEGSALASYKAKFGARPARWSSHHFEHLPVTASAARARDLYGATSRLARGLGSGRTSS